MARLRAIKSLANAHQKALAELRLAIHQEQIGILARLRTSLRSINSEYETASIASDDLLKLYTDAGIDTSKVLTLRQCLVDLQTYADEIPKIIDRISDDFKPDDDEDPIDDMD